MADPSAWTFTTGGDRTEQWDWVTDALQSLTGPEQLRSIRISPRIALGASGLEEGDRRRTLETQLHANGTGPWYVPLDTDALRLTTPLALAGTVVAGDASLLRFTVGGKALLLGADGTSALVQVASFNGSGVVLSAGVAAAWPVGTLLAPAYLARFDRMPSLARFTGDSVAYSLAFRLATTIDITPADNLPVYRDFPVLELPHDWTSDPEWSPDREPQVVDWDIALPVVHDLIGEPRTGITRVITAVGRADVYQLLRVLYLLKGRFQPVWVPSLGHDLRAAGGMSSSGTTLNVGACGLVAAGIRTTRRDVRIALRDGTVLYRRITALATVDAVTERITVDTAWPASVAPADIVHIGFMTFARQAADTNKIAWWRNDVAMTDLAFVGIVDHDV